MKFLDVAFAIRIGDDLVFDGGLQSMGRQEFADRVGGLIDDRAGAGKRAVVERQLCANRIVEFAVGEPWKIVEIGGNALGFFEVET